MARGQEIHDGTPRQTKGTTTNTGGRRRRREKACKASNRGVRSVTEGGKKNERSSRKPGRQTDRRNKVGLGLGRRACARCTLGRQRWARNPGGGGAWDDDACEWLFSEKAAPPKDLSAFLSLFLPSKGVGVEVGTRAACVPLSRGLLTSLIGFFTLTSDTGILLGIGKGRADCY